MLIFFPRTTGLIVKIYPIHFEVILTTSLDSGVSIIYSYPHFMLFLACLTFEKSKILTIFLLYSSYIWLFSLTIHHPTNETACRLHQKFSCTKSRLYFRGLSQNEHFPELTVLVVGFLFYHVLEVRPLTDRVFVMLSLLVIYLSASSYLSSSSMAFSSSWSLRNCI